MRQDLLRLYQALTPARRTEAPIDESLESVPAAPSAAELVPPEHPPLLPEQLHQLERLNQTDPEAVRSFFSSSMGGREISPQDARRILDELRQDLEQPGAAESDLEGLFSRDEPVPPPPGFTFDLYDPASIPINANRRDFQDNDYTGYILSGGVNAALFHAGVLPLGAFRRHEDYASLFTYDLGINPGQDLKVALFADFANGYYTARYIAKRFEKNRYPYAIHLGDVYYAGRENEVKSYLEEPMRPVLPTTELFLLSGNHEMYSKGVHWLAYLDRKRHPERQRQEGTYFRLLRDKFQIIGIDTEWFGHLHFKEPWLKLWLQNALQEGRRQGRMNILLSSNEPYSYGKSETTQLHSELADVLDQNLVDLWFWGNTHYCALFTRNQKFPFVGSCIGHGGYPYFRFQAGSSLPVPTRFLEDGSRFGGGAWPDPRPDVGNNGFCELTLRSDGKVQLTYIDWIGRTRHQAVLARGAGGTVDFVAP
jgi:predicted phosphodiesterase